MFNKVNEVIDFSAHSTIERNMYENQNAVFKMDSIVQKLVLAVGCGSVGSNAISMLNRFGIQTFLVFDPDVLEVKNMASGMFPVKLLRDYGAANREVLRIHPTGYIPVSPFKVDIITKFLLEHTDDTFVKGYKVRYPPEYYDFSDHIGLLNQNAEKFGILTSNPTYYKEVFLLDVKTPRPDVVVVTTDSLRSRLLTAFYLYDKYHSNGGSIPLIDIRITDVFQGQGYCIDVLNEDHLLKYFNTILKEDISSIDELNEDNIKALELADIQGQACGNRMSTLSANMGAINIVSMVAGLFRESSKPDFDAVPRKMFFSLFNNEFIKQFNSVSDDISL